MRKSEAPDLANFDNAASRRRLGFSNPPQKLFLARLNLVRFESQATYLDLSVWGISSCCASSSISSKSSRMLARIFVTVEAALRPTV